MPGSAAPLVPRYGTRSLAELVPSLLSSLGLHGFASPLALEPAARVCLLLVDGLGWELLQANRPAAPFLNSIASEPLTAGFPATTAASLSSLATGLPPGEHGLVGYTMALPGYDRAFNTLTWSLYGLGPRVDLAEHPDLATGVRLLAGEARARYVSTVPGATADVLSAWRSVLGDRMWIWEREEAIATGIFGPRVTDRARERIGDLVAAAYDRIGIVQRDVDPAQARLNGHHGSLTAAEQLVPFLVYRS